MFRLPDERFGFYDLEPDPVEQANLLDGDRVHDGTLVRSLRKQLEAWRDDVGSRQPDPVQSRKHIEALKSLGYVGEKPEKDD